MLQQFGTKLASISPPFIRKRIGPLIFRAVDQSEAIKSSLFKKYSHY